MQQSLIMSFIAEDRPGIVDALSEVIAQQQGNWLESRLTRLGGQFTGIVRIEINEDAVDDLENALQGLAVKGITYTLSANHASVSSEELFPVNFKVTGDDRPGIVKELSALMANCGANIESLNTYISHAPWSGGLLFTMEGSATLPPTLGKGHLRSKLEGISDDLIVEIDPA
ncbi:ACT domain-containing protein [Dasania marina]|mgnify:CR=1 FL=1|uniref:glycine cleavage system protein R n=1 Tax=Dasania marina TaxID=471499 RepID=UPI0030DA3FA1|tara:strand:- start:23572 stop:24087 length:516 start_codon:yes stop_codon:yes gene_type:complete